MYEQQLDPCALRQITVPILITAMAGHYFIADNEIHYDVAAPVERQAAMPAINIATAREPSAHDGQYAPQPVVRLTVVPSAP